MNDCPHLHVTIHSHLCARETRFVPAEYIHWATCDDCGESMDVGDIPEGAEEREE